MVVIRFAALLAVMATMAGHTNAKPSPVCSDASTDTPSVTPTFTPATTDAPTPTPTLASTPAPTDPPTSAPTPTPTQPGGKLTLSNSATHHSTVFSVQLGTCYTFGVCFGSGMDTVVSTELPGNVSTWLWYTDPGCIGSFQLGLIGQRALNITKSSYLTLKSVYVSPVREITPTEKMAGFKDVCTVA